MKQIFDWLRKQMNETLKPDIECFEDAEDFELALKRHGKYLDFVNEAEAKWEAVLAELEEERDYSYADFEEYVNRYSPFLDAECDDFFHKGLGRAIEIVRKGGVE